MKITVDIPDEDLKDIMRFAGGETEGSAVARFFTFSLMLRRRRELSEEVMSGAFRCEFPHWEEMQKLDSDGHWPA